MNVLIPMAGKGSRFAEAGYVLPKPLIDVDGRPMIEAVIENLGSNLNYIFVVQSDHVKRFGLDEVLKKKSPNCKIVEINEVTEGAACTVLLAQKEIDNDEPLLIANSDQYLEWNRLTPDASVDGKIVTFKSKDPNCSYIKERAGVVIECREKEKISDIATVGLYYWSKGSDFVKYAKQMIKKDIRVSGEFYVCPVYNEAIADGKTIKSFPVKYVWQIGTPEDLRRFIRLRPQNDSWQDYP
jgi:dTDP-glucose pyrophosphorylase